MGATIGLAVGTDKIATYYEYADGTTSFGSDKILNGVYQGTHFNFVAGGQVSYGIGDGLMVYVNAEYIFGCLPGIGSPLTDWHYGKSLDLQQPLTGIPTDYESFLDTQGDFDYPVDAYVHGDFNGIRLEVGLRFQFGDSW